ncbi:MAG: ABC transporter permease, partial [Oscillospiraceae bacterium]
MKSLKNNVKFASASKTLLTSLLALFCALFITGIIIAICGYNPIEIFVKVFAESFASRASIALCLSQATPLIFAGLSFAVGLKVGLINVGVEGQLVTGAMAAALCGVYVKFLPGDLHVIVCVLLAACAGGAVNLFTTYLKVKTDAPEVITGIMLNTILTLIASYLVNGPLKAEGASIGKTEQILPSAELTRIIPRTQLTTAFIIAIVIAIVMHIVLNKTVLGYKMRVTGLNKRAAAVAGIKSSSIYYSSSFISGSIAGIAGAAVALGVYRCYMENLSVGYGFAGIPVAAL